MSGGGEQEFDSVEMDESQEQGRSQFNVMSTEFYPAQQFQQGMSIQIVFVDMPFFLLGEC